MDNFSLFPTERELTPQKRFNELDGQRKSLLNRVEDYALWTLPYMFPRSDVYSASEEKTGPIDSTGSQAVNNLANKIVLTLFQPAQPFFRLMASDDLLLELQEAAENGDRAAQAVLDKLDESLALAEKRALRELNYTHYRTEAATVATALIITGNSLIYHPEGKGKAQVYSLRDYVVVRDLSGVVIELITRDTKAFGTFSKKVQEQIYASDKQRYNNAGKQVCIYTRVRLQEDGRYKMDQSADDIPLDSEGTWPADELPWIVLTWKLLRGEDYGRGLVEDYAGAFHGLYVLTHAFVDTVGIAADIKWLVKPTSMLDVKRLNESRSGTYHSGEEGDITAVQVDKAQDLQIVQAMIQDWRTQIGRAFLMFNSVQRDAERVTAEEIRYMINDLEMSNGGIYSRLAEEWQYSTAKLILKRVDIRIGDGRQVYPQIITGLDSLSRAGDMDNLRLFMSDMALLNNMPAPAQAEIDMNRYAAYCGVRRGVDYKKFLKTQEQKAAEQQQMMQMNQAAIDQQTGAAVATEAAAASMQE